MQEIPEDEGKETKEQKKLRHLELVRSAQLTRKELIYLLSDIPAAEVEGIVKNAFVVIRTAEKQYPLAEVMGVEPCPAYECRHPQNSKMVKQLVLKLRCKRGLAEKFTKAAAISTAKVKDVELEQWSKVMHNCRIDPQLYLDKLEERAAEISKFDDCTPEVLENGWFEKGSGMPRRFTFRFGCSAMIAHLMQWGWSAT
eukprot:Skav207453  [mRNA]  locus=scaffold3545:75139:75732:+ [translate_table: standard]